MQTGPVVLQPDQTYDVASGEQLAVSVTGVPATGLMLLAVTEQTGVVVTGSGAHITTGGLP